MINETTLSLPALGKVVQVKRVYLEKISAPKSKR